jgi:hypothetical protein
MSLDRRQFLLSAGGLTIGSQFVGRPFALAAPQKSKASRCILVYLLGGPSHIDMWDLKPEAPAEIRGPFAPIDTATPGLQICEHMPKLALLSQRYAIVRSVSHNNHNHTPMIYYTLTGREVERPEMDNDVRPPQRADFPHVGGVLAAFCPPRGVVPNFVAIPKLAVRSSTAGEFKRAQPALRGGGAGFLGSLCDPLCIDGEPGAREGAPALVRPAEISGDRHEGRARLLSLLESRRSRPGGETYREFREQAIAITGAESAAGQVFLIENEPQETRQRYGDHRFGKAMLLARRLSEAGVAMTAIHFNGMTVCDGWDTHSKNFEGLRDELLPMLDQGLSALVEDLADRGLLEETLVVVMGEFGRTPKINAAAGRDHWGLCQSVLMAGGGIRGGQVVGASDKIASMPVSHAVDPVDIHATIYHCLGLDPHQSMVDHLGRPHPLSAGRALTELL